MPHEDDATLIARDRRLVGLALLLDDEAMTAAVRRAAPQAGIESLEGRYLRYKPETNCVCAYQVRASGGAITQLYAKAFAPGDPGIEKTHAPIAESELGGRLPGTLLLPDHHIRIWAFPNDQRVRALDRIGADESRRRLLRRTLPDREAWWNATVETLAYKPDRRFVGRLDLDGHAVATLRLYTRKGFARSLDRARYLAATGFPQAPILEGTSERHAAIVNRWVAGRSLLDDLIAGALDVDLVGAAGAALARLHRVAPRDLPRLEPRDELAALRAAVSEIAVLEPALGERALALSSGLEDELASRSPSAILHGDFYPKQVVASSSGVTLIDLDGACAGHPSLDLGNFLAHLERYRASGRVDERFVDPAAQALLDGYRADGGLIDRASVRVSTAASLLRLASHPFRRREPGWKRAVTAMLDSAERALAERMAVV